MSRSQKTHIALILTVMVATATGPLGVNSTAVAQVTVESGSADMYAQSSSAPAAVTVPAEAAAWGFLAADDETTFGELALVVPDREMDLAATNQVIEDLGIMSRIIEKSVLTPYGVRQSGWREVFVGGYGSPGTYGPRALFPSGGRTKPLYIAGYGATFFIQVDFPLLAPPEQKQEQPAPSQEDPVWAQTKQSLLDSRATGAATTEKSAAQPFNQARLEGFRRSLIATMKHATNIRALGASEGLTFVVQGPAPSTAAAGQNARTRVVLPMVGGIPSGRSVMTLRTTKADVDAYGKGQLSPEQFEQRVQVITY